MTQWVKAPDDLNSIPGTHTVVAIQYSENVSYILRDWNFCWTSEPELGTQVDLCEFKVSLVYRENSRTARTTHRDILSQKTREREDNIKLNLTCLGFPV